MDYLQKFINQVRAHILLLLILDNLVILLSWIGFDYFLELNELSMILATSIMSALMVSLLVWIGADYIVKPTILIRQAILHIAPNATEQPAADLKQASLGREMVTALVSQIYQLASVADTVSGLAKKEARDLSHDFVANTLPLPLLVLDKNENIVFTNTAMQEYLKLSGDDLLGKNIYSTVSLAFSNENTFDSWLTGAKTGTVIASSVWDRVKMVLPIDKTTRLFDLVAYYNKDNPNSYETMIVMFDRTRQYTQDEQAINFVALAVHEIRTPLTLMRGYIEVFEEELGDKLDTEQTEFMYKLKDAAKQLTSFTNTILNVSRFDNDQLTLQLSEEKWPDILSVAVNDLKQRSKLRNVEITTEIAPNLPTVGVDRIAIYEVVSNLVDNAIKYSGDSKKILVKTYLTQDGLVETIVQDYGVGIPQGALGSLFEKFYRDYHNRAQVGGTGMGLYLSKGIIQAHGGTIWVKSKEGQGSVFGFTILPYANLAAERKNSDNKDIVRTAHGWIKNHSMYRR